MQSKLPELKKDTQEKQEAIRRHTQERGASENTGSNKADRNEATKTFMEIKQYLLNIIK